MIKRAASAMLIVALMLSAAPAGACVGKTIVIGVPDTLAERVLAELVAVLLNERTGTTVEIKRYPDRQGVLNAAKTCEAGIMFENVEHALAVLGEKGKTEDRERYNLAKIGYRKRFDLVWLESLGSLGDKPEEQRHYGPVITAEIMRNFPALPRVINKLSRVISPDAFSRMSALARSGGELKAIARDYLRSQKLI